MDEIRRWYREKNLLKVVASLKNRGFDATYFPDTASLNKRLLENIPKSATIGIGGSVTIRELHIIEEFEKRGNEVIHHWQQGLTEETDEEIRRKEMLADYYLTSANAITVDGDIVNIDGIGNRVAAMIYGPKNVIIIAGYNKIVSSIDEGIKRSKTVAAVMNAKRVNARTPCVETGICTDCDAPKRICRVISIIQYCPWQTNISVMLINERLGF